MLFEENWPENDPTMSLEDARFSVLRYFAADIQNIWTKCTTLEQEKY
jgi:hypothetical protein